MISLSNPAANQVAPFSIQLVPRGEAFIPEDK
jgi:hypothetical protein